MNVDKKKELDKIMKQHRKVLDKPVFRYIDDLEMEARDFYYSFPNEVLTRNNYEYFFHQYEGTCVEFKKDRKVRKLYENEINYFIYKTMDIALDMEYKFIAAIFNDITSYELKWSYGSDYFAFSDSQSEFENLFIMIDTLYKIWLSYTQREDYVSDYVERNRNVMDMNSCEKYFIVDNRVNIGKAIYLYLTEYRRFLYEYLKIDDNYIVSFLNTEKWSGKAYVNGWITEKYVEHIDNAKLYPEKYIGPNVNHVLKAFVRDTFFTWGVTDKNAKKEIEKRAGLSMHFQRVYKRQHFMCPPIPARIQKEMRENEKETQ